MSERERKKACSEKQKEKKHIYVQCITLTGMKVITTTEQKMYHLLQSISSMRIYVFGVFRVAVVRPCVVRTRFLSLVLKMEIRSRV